MTFIVLDFFEPVGVALRVDENFCLGHVEVQAAVRHPVLAQFRGDFPQGADPCLQVGEFRVAQVAQRPAGRAGLVFWREGQGADAFEIVFEQEGVGLLVGQPLAAANDGVRVGRLLGPAVFGESQEHGLAQAILGFHERTQTVRKLFRQHRDDDADEIGGIAPSLRFEIQRGTRADVGRDICDVDADAHLAAVQ